MKQILATGGTGYIGSHAVVELQNAGFEVVIIDNLSGSKREVVDKIAKITGKKPIFHQIDLTHPKSLDEIFAKYHFDAVIHFAGLKSVTESIEQPLKYYQNNVIGTLNLLQSMQKHSVKNLIFSSSATVYGNPETLPLTEENRTGTGITNPYGWTKYMIEQIIKDVATADKSFSATLLRYFNPIGAHPSGLIGESPTGRPNNIAPFIARVAQGWLPEFPIFGSDYNTPDGTGIRDFIDVVDLARGHVATLNAQKPGTHIYNLATGKGTSVLELITAYKSASGREIPFSYSARRSGDLPEVYASSKKAQKDLSWIPQTSLHESLQNDWKWRQNETK